MKRTMLVMAMVIALAMSTMAGAFANGRWDSQVTGGGEFVAGLNYFDLAVSSRTADDGTIKGMFQYTREGQPADDLSAHGVVDCLYVATNGDVAMSGYVKVQEGSFADYASVVLTADGEGVRFHAVSPGTTTCGYSNTFPGSLVEGNFNIR